MFLSTELQVLLAKVQHSYTSVWKLGKSLSLTKKSGYVMYCYSASTDCICEVEIMEYMDIILCIYLGICI